MYRPYKHKDIIVGLDLFLLVTQASCYILSWYISIWYDINSLGFLHQNSFYVVRTRHNYTYLGLVLHNQGVAVQYTVDSLNSMIIIKNTSKDNFYTALDINNIHM